MCIYIYIQAYRQAHAHAYTHMNTHTHTQAALELHSRVINLGKTTGAVLGEYTMCHLIRVCKGMSLCNPASIKEPSKYVSLLLHEFERVYGDGLPVASDRAVYQKMVREVLRRFFKVCMYVCMYVW
jgi:hypothetical protein